ncbi:uncharacterized protein [Rutidosis leptorrhynchoides]|uniref:uncharacterized protein n=1 Tax=Rutidosis leptorrhynchoides TaxID=125765 RepID=UPI003A99A6F9
MNMRQRRWQELIKDYDLDRLKIAQLEPLQNEHLKSELMVKRRVELMNDSRGLKTYRERVWVPLFGGLRDLILNEAHKLRLSVHPGITKMYHDLKVLYWWPTMKVDIAQYVEKKCRTPSCWLEAGEKQFAGLKIVHQTAEKVAIAREKLKAARDRQKMYADPRRRPMTFTVGEHLPLQDLKVDSSKKLVEEPVRIVDRKVTKLRKKEISMVLVEWKHSLGTNLTWETEKLMTSRYPQLFNLDQIPRMETPLRRVDF